MAEIRPFEGLRYRPDRVGDLGAVLAPPYDVVSPEDQAALYGRSPYNVVRLECGRQEPGDDERVNRYTRAAAALARWLEEGVLEREARPCFYLYEQEFPRGGRRSLRRALFARVRLEAWERGIVRPHERTLSPPKEDRLRLLRECRAQVSPVFALYRDEGDAVRRALDGAAEEAALDVRDAGGERHRLHVIDDPRAQASLERLFAARPLTVADGHHRYETALAYREERKAKARSWTGEEPENFVLMGLTAVEDPGLVILPIHRLVRAPAPPDLRRRLGRHFRVERATDEETADLPRRLAEKGRETAVFGLCETGLEEVHWLTLTDREAVLSRMPNGSPADWRSLDTNILQYGILEPVLGISEDAVAGGGILRFTEDAREAVEKVRGGRCGLAFLLNPTRTEQVLSVADAGWRLPPKSTFFFPKLATGLVLNPLGPPGGRS